VLGCQGRVPFRPKIVLLPGGPHQHKDQSGISFYKKVPTLVKENNIFCRTSLCSGTFPRGRGHRVQSEVGRPMRCRNSRFLLPKRGHGPLSQRVAPTTVHGVSRSEEYSPRPARMGSARTTRRKCLPNIIARDQHAVQCHSSREVQYVYLPS